MLFDYLAYGGTLSGLSDTAVQAERAGFSGWSIAEGNQDPFLSAALVARSTNRISISTAVAIALARTPMLVAYQSHAIQELALGRFELGLGTQVRAHIERRYGMRWDKPVAQMRDFIAAVRAIWESWESDTDLIFDSQYYRYSLMPPAFRPLLSSCEPPAINLAAVGPAMCRLAGEVADGLVCHPFAGPKYVEQVMLPAAVVGLSDSGRDRESLSITGSVMVITGNDDVESALSEQQVRHQIAFYASTRAYSGILETYEFEELGIRASALVRENRWDELNRLVTDEILDAFAIQCTPEAVVGPVRSRYSELFDRVSLSFYGVGLPTNLNVYT